MANLSSLDIKLLIVFDAIMRERNITRAAYDVNMTQPSVSNALSRLRTLFDDQLFVRVRGGVEPTPRAVELAGPVREALGRLHDILEPVTFSPATAVHTFQLAVSEPCAILVIPELQKRIAAEAPGIRFRLKAKRNRSLVADFESGEVHFALGIMERLPPRMQRVALFEDAYVCVMRPSHPLASGPLSPEDFLAAEHIAVTHRRDTSVLVDDKLADIGVTRNVVATVHQISLAPLILESRDVILITYRRLVPYLERYTDLSVAPLPFDIGVVVNELAWSDKLSAHPGHHWLREQISDVCATLPRPGPSCST